MVLSLDEWIEDAAVNYSSSALRTWYFSNETVAGIVASPTFKMKKVAAVKSDDGELVRIDFDRLLTDPQKRSFSYSDAFMVCDPERSWALKEYGSTGFDGQVIFRTTVKFGELVQGFPIPERITHLSSSPNDPTISRSVITVELTRKDIPKEEFYLSHYGLPEPTFQRGWFWTWVWYLVAAIVCFVTSAIVVKRRRACG